MARVCAAGSPKSQPLGQLARMELTCTRRDYWITFKIRATLENWLLPLSPWRCQTRLAATFCGSPCGSRETWLPKRDTRCEAVRHRLQPARRSPSGSPAKPEPISPFWMRLRLRTKSEVWPRSRSTRPSFAWTVSDSCFDAPRFDLHSQPALAHLIVEIRGSSDELQSCSNVGRRAGPTLAQAPLSSAQAHATGGHSISNGQLPIASSAVMLDRPTSKAHPTSTACRPR